NAESAESPAAALARHERRCRNDALSPSHSAYKSAGCCVTPSRIAASLIRPTRYASSCRLAPRLSYRVSDSHMATNLSIDPKLIERALEVSGERTKKAAVTKALEEFIARRRQKRLLELMGKLEWDTSYDYKKERSRD